MVSQGPPVVPSGVVREGVSHTKAAGSPWGGQVPGMLLSALGGLETRSGVADGLGDAERTEGGLTLTQGQVGPGGTLLETPRGLRAPPFPLLLLPPGQARYSPWPCVLQVHTPGPPLGSWAGLKSQCHPGFPSLPLTLSLWDCLVHHCSLTA